MVLVAPSILSGNFGCLADEARRIEQAKADAIHIDIMDGHFVPNLTLGPRAVEAIRRSTDLFLDVHLMIYQPFDFIERFVKAGANRITFHFEATEDLEETISYIKKCNVEVGLSFRPETSIEMVTKYLDLVDLVLIMTVNPGFGGQAFMSDMLEKITFVKKACETKKVSPHIQVDGGITDVTGKQCVDAGADFLVSGSYLFGQQDLATGISRLKGLS